MITQEDKELLLKDLSARLPYGVICTGKYIEFDDNDNLIFIDATGELTQVHFTKNCCYLNVGLMHECKLETVKPYLRPMSSMTKEEMEEYNDTWELDRKDILTVEDELSDVYKHKGYESIWEHPVVPLYRYIEWLNAHHFDYRGLIEKGLALEAPQGMYEKE